MDPSTILLAGAALLFGALLGWRLSASRRTPPAGPARPLTAFEAGVANVTNLLNNRLNAIVGFAELVDRATLSPEDREALDQVRIDARAAAGIVRDMIHLVRQPGPGEGATHLPTVLADVLEHQRGELATHHIAVSLEIEPAVSLVVGEREELANLLVRLLDFATVRLRHAPAGGAGGPRRVTWIARPLGASVVFMQEDTGPPLPHGLAWHELNYFRPADPQFQGALELALAQRVAENCGAGLRLEAGPAGGAEVTMTLIPARLIETPPPRSHGVAPLTHGHVLLAEDDEANRRAVTRLLEQHGHRVTAVADGVEALAQLHAGAFDVVVVDLQMPRRGGREVYEETLARSPAMAQRFVFVTGDADRADSREFLSAVPQPVVRKPYDVRDLLAAIDQVAR